MDDAPTFSGGVQPRVLVLDGGAVGSSNQLCTVVRGDTTTAPILEVMVGGWELESAGWIFGFLVS